MLVILSKIWLYKTENFKWRNSGPHQIGHNKRLVILSVVIISGTVLKIELSVLSQFLISFEIEATYDNRSDN